MLDQKTIDTICDLAAKSDLASYKWSGRGKAPIGYIKGLACTYALVLKKLQAKDSAALAMVRIVDDGHDVFDHYADKLSAAKIITEGASDVDRLRALWVILAGLGMRESSGGVDIGRDSSASNTSSDTAEAGIWQTSWNIRGANSAEIEKLFDAYSEALKQSLPELRGMLAIFWEGVAYKPGAWEEYGDGDGRRFQELCKSCPTFAAQVAAIGLRTLYTHWGPIVRREVEIVTAADNLFRQVQALIGIQSSPPATSGGGWLAAAVGAMLALFRHGPNTPPPADLASRLVAAMRKHNYRIDTKPGEINIAYVEGMGPDGDKNDNAPNEFNDARFVIAFEGGKPVLKGAWQATTEPGRYWTMNPMNDAGAARLKPGQYTAWQIGDHHGHEAWVQTGGPVTVCRDRDRDFKRDGDAEDTGYFGINQHWGYDLPKNDLGRSSAGCLVGRMRKGHEEFMAITKSDPRFVANNRFVVTTCLLLAKDV